MSALQFKSNIFNYEVSNVTAYTKPFDTLWLLFSAEFENSTAYAGSSVT